MGVYVVGVCAEVSISVPLSLDNVPPGMAMHICGEVWMEVCGDNNTATPSTASSVCFMGVGGTE